MDPTPEWHVEDATSLTMPLELKGVKFLNISEVCQMMRNIRNNRESADDSDGESVNEEPTINNPTTTPPVISDEQEEEEKKKEVPPNPKSPLTNWFHHMLEYVESCQTFKGDNIRIIKDALTASPMNLHEFEKASLANLCPQTHEEAESLIPTLEKQSYIDVKLILEELELRRSLQY